MKVVDIQVFRARKLMRELEKTIEENIRNPSSGSVRQIKTCFKDWLKYKSLS